MSEKRTVRKSLKEIKKEVEAGKSRTDWERVTGLADEEIEAAVASDPDAELLGAEWFRAARLVIPTGEKEQISIRLDDEVLDFFRSQGRGYQTRINDVLRAYVLTQRLKEQRETLDEKPQDDEAMEGQENSVSSNNP